DYEEAGEQTADLVKVDILLQGEPVDAFSAVLEERISTASRGATGRFLSVRSSSSPTRRH
ncbi:MAG: hypothetical protein JO285_10390, partial [Kutzneria sp.]|nr:hypothetical protein [Kutzneria sp.]